MGFARTGVMIKPKDWKSEQNKRILNWICQFGIISPTFKVTLPKPRLGDYWHDRSLQVPQKMSKLYNLYRITIWNRDKFVILGLFLAFGAKKRVKYPFLTNMSFITFNCCKKPFIWNNARVSSTKLKFSLLEILLKFSMSVWTFGKQKLNISVLYQYFWTNFFYSRWIYSLNVWWVQTFYVCIVLVCAPDCFRLWCTHDFKGCHYTFQDKMTDDNYIHQNCQKSSIPFQDKMTNDNYIH